jgi:hypothetical protein
MGLDNSSGVGGIVIIDIFDNGSQLVELNFRAGSYINGAGANEQADVYLSGLTNNSTHNISAKLRSANLSAAVGGQGTSAARTSVLNVYEI